MVIAMFMILEQLNIAEQIVEIAFAATMGALALGLALAFGLGGRGDRRAHARGRLRRKGQENQDQVKQDLQTGQDRAQQQADTVRAQHAGSDNGAPAGDARGSSRAAQPNRI